MQTSFFQCLSTSMVGATFILLESILATPSQATTLTNYSTYGSQMGGMQVKVDFLDGTSQTATWAATDSVSGEAVSNNWFLYQSGNTYGYDPYNGDYGWTFDYSGNSGVKALEINAIPGNTVFDINPSLDSPQNTPGSAEGWEFQIIRNNGANPDSYSYSVPIDISQGDLFGKLSILWNQGFNGRMRFIADTDSGTTTDPVKPKDPPPPPIVLPPPPPPVNTAPTLDLSDYTINEGQSAAATLFATDPNPDAINFYLNSNLIGTDGNTSGTRSATVNLGTYANNGSFPLIGQAVDSQGGASSIVNRTLTVLNVAPTLTSFALNVVDGDITIDEGQSLAATATANDPGLYDDLTFSVNGNPVGTDTTDTTGTRTISTNLGTFNDDTTATYSAIARDSDQADSNVITRTVTVKNVAPTLTAFNLLSDTIDEGQYGFANLFATDPGADPITFSINGNSIGTDGTLSGVRQIGNNLGFFGNQGTFTFNGQANDDDGGFSQIIEKTLTVKNVAPTITSLIAPLSVMTGNLFNFAATATDPGINDILTYDWDFNNDGIFDFTGINGQWSFDRSGFYTGNLRVSDGDGGFAYRSFTVESVPEPSSIAGILVLGIASLSWRLWRRQPS